MKAVCTSGRGKKCYNVKKGYVIFIWVYVLAVFFGLLSGIGSLCSADDVHAKEIRDKPGAAATAVQNGPTENKDGERADDRAKADGAVIARVNGAAITGGTLRRMMELVASEEAPPGGESPEVIDTGKVREKALNRLIFQELVYQRARSEGITVEEKDVDAAVSNIKAGAGGEEAYKRGLKELSKTEDEERAEFKRFLTIKRLYEREISGKVAITEDDVKREYERKKDNFVIPEAVSVIDIVFFLDTGKAESFKKVEEIRGKIIGDKDKNPLNLVPDGTFIVREIGINKTKDEELYKEARRLKEGELSGVINTGDSLHVIQLKNYSPARQLTFEQMKMYLEKKMRALAKQERITKWEGELRKGAKIEVMPPEAGNY